MKLLSERRENKKFFRNNLEQFPALIVVVRGVHMPRGHRIWVEIVTLSVVLREEKKNLFGDTLFFSALLKKKSKQALKYLCFYHLYTYIHKCIYKLYVILWYI